MNTNKKISYKPSYLSLKVVTRSMVTNGVINASVDNIYDIAWHYASVDDRDATNAEISGIKRDIDVAWLVICGKSCTYALPHTVCKGLCFLDTI